MNLIFTIVNSGYKFFALNFLKRWKQLNISDEILFVCTDQEVFNFLRKYNARCVLNEQGISKNLEVWYTSSYRNIAFKKLDLTKDILLKYRNDYEYITYIDTDIWMNVNFLDNINVILKNNDFDIIFQDGEDYLRNSDESCELINNTLIQKRPCINYCTGFMCFNTKKLNSIINLFNYTNEDVIKHTGNQIFMNKKLQIIPNIKKFVLPKVKFLNFSTTRFESIPDYWALHYNFLIGYSKIYYMKKYKHWLLEPDINK